MFLDAKSFDLDVFGSPNLQIKDFNILEHDTQDAKNFEFKVSKTFNIPTMFLDAKSFDLDVFGSPNFKIGAMSLVLKASIWMSLDSEISKSNILTSWCMT